MPRAVGDDEVGRGLVRVADGGVARRHRARLRPLLVDQVAALGGVAVREQGLQRHPVEVRVREVGVPVREGEARGLEHEVERPGAVRGEVAVALEDVERLAHRRAAARGRAHAPDVEAAVADAGGRALDRAVVLDVRPVHEARPPGVVGIRGLGRILSRLDHVASDRALVEGVRPVPRDAPIRAREVRVGERGVHVPRCAVGVEIDRRGGRDVVEPVDVWLGL